MHDETLLAFDFGLRRIGVALGEIRLGKARALTCIAHESNAARFAAITDLIAKWQPARLLVGRPLNEDGSAHDMTARCARFANQLRGRFALPVEEVVERFSSLEADAALKHTKAFMSGKTGFTAPHQSRLSWQERKMQIDAESARVILQSWLETHAHQTA